MTAAGGAAGTWIVERASGGRLPYRLQIVDARGTPYLTLRAQDRWPAANRNIFCIREAPQAAPEMLTEVERVPIVALRRNGVRLTVILGRARYKRCDFLFVSRAARAGGPAVEQIFWQTHGSMTQHRTRIASGVLAKKADYTVKIASDERYPWTFPGSNVVRGILPAGDYALLQDGEAAAVVERKTLDNMLGDFGIMPVLHQRLLELSSYEHNAFVIEAPYEDFLNPAKLHHYSPVYCAKVIASLYARHPRVRIVFCSNRKAANLWTRNYFAAVAAQMTESDREPITG
jgi:hypothetical protein